MKNQLRKWTAFFILVFPICLALSHPLVQNFITFLCSLTFSWICSAWIKRLILCLNRYNFCPKKKAVLISGCDRGIGHGTALALYKFGFTVFAACLDDKSEGALKLACLNSNRMIVLKLDVTSEKELNNALLVINFHLLNHKLKLWAIINNAAVSRTGMVEWGSFDCHFREIFDTNVLGTVHLTRKFLPMIRESRGHVIVISSIAGRVTEAGMVAYSMTKHSLISFSDGLRLELARFGVKVTSIEPWFARTPMMELKEALYRLDMSWITTDLNVQLSYGNQDRKKLKRKIKVLTQTPFFGLDQSFNGTITSILRNITSPEPEYSEKVCSMWQRPLLFALYSLPREWVDALINSFSWALELVLKLQKSKKSKPKVLQ